MIIKDKNNSRKKGFTLLELVLYIGGLLALGAILIVLITQIYMLYKEIVAVPRADRTGLLVVDRLVKDIRSADSVNLLYSQFNASDGQIALQKQDGDVTSDHVFFVEDGRVMYQEDDATAEPITGRDLYVSNFNFSLVTTDVSEAVRFAMEISFMTRNGTQTKDFIGFAILRESYD